MPAGGTIFCKPPTLSVRFILLFLHGPGPDIFGHLRLTPALLPATDDADDLGQGPGPNGATHCVLAPLRLWNEVVLVNGL